MKMLLKYEIRKTMFVKLIILGITALLELLFLYGLWSDREEPMAIGASLLAVTGITAIMVVGLGSVLSLHRDMNTKQSYMLFMTPNSSYKILGAKVLENGVSILLIGAGFFALGALDITLLFAKESALNQLWDMIQRVLTTMDERLTLNAPILGSFFLSALCGWFAVVTAAYLGDVLSATLLSGKRFSGLVSFILIIALLIILGKLQSLAGGWVSDLVGSFCVESAISLVCSVIMYYLTARLMESSLSV